MRPTAKPETLPEAHLAGVALQALARAARSLVLYDAGNATVRLHLSEYHAKMAAALDAGEMIVTVAPFQFAVGGNIVLEDRDREKSLPYKLYRDGIRVVRFLTATTWDELLALLRIIAIRYASVRLQEEDAVTLIRRADFKGIQIETVEGFAQLEEFPEPAMASDVERSPTARPPAGWDMPLQKLPAPAEYGYRKIAPEALAELEDDGDEEAIAALSIGLASDLLAEAMRNGWPTPNRDLFAFFMELRDALLIDGKLDRLRQLVEVLATAGASDLRDHMLRGLADARTLELVLATVPEDEAHLPPELAPFLPLLGVVPALDQLAAATSEGRRRLLTKIVLARLPREVDPVIHRIGAFEPRVVHELAEGIVARAPERSTDLARELLAQKEESFRLVGLDVIDKTTARIPLRPVCDLLKDPSERIRVRAAEVLGRRGDASVVEPLCACLTEARSFSAALADAVGRAIAALAPGRAVELFGGWLEPKGRFLVGLSVAQRLQQWAAVSGTGLLPGDQADAALRGLADRSDGDLRRLCLSTLTKRRRGGDARG